MASTRSSPRSSTLRSARSDEAMRRAPRRVWRKNVCASGTRCSPPGGVLSRAHIYGYGHSLRPCQGTTIAPRRRAFSRQTLLALLFAFRLRKLVGRHVLEKLLELGDDLLLVHLFALELDRRLLDHVVGREDRRLGADSERDRVRGTGVDLDLGAVLLDGDARVE